MDYMGLFKKNSKKNREPEIDGENELIKSFQKRFLIKTKKEKKFQNQVGTHYVKSLPLLETTNISSISDELKDGNIIIVNIQSYFNAEKTSFINLKRTIEQLSHLSRKAGGEIVQLSKELILITPNPTIKIWKNSTCENQLTIELDI